MELLKDIWTAGIVSATVPAILARGTVEGLPVTWLPSAGPLRYLADPFGLWRDGRLHVFAEIYDYRVRVGAIEVLVFDAGFRLLEQRRVLSEPWHLSYPFVFEAQGTTWMLPEANRSRTLTLYRAVEFPFRWEPAHRIVLDQTPIDATPLFHEGLWWLFYTSAARRGDNNSALRISWSERLAGPWHAVPGNPVRVDASGGRPGGTPQIIDGKVMLPVQDCSRTYGGALRPLWFDTLTPGKVAMTAGPSLTAPASFAPFTAGLHTLAAAGDVTLIDVKRRLFSPRGLAVDLRRKVRKKLLRRSA
ncbi:MAG: formyl transferase [Pseudomonadota bacterium]